VITETETKWKNWWGNQVKQHKKTTQGQQGAIAQL